MFEIYLKERKEKQNIYVQSKYINKALIDMEMDRYERLNIEYTKAKKIDFDNQVIFFQ